MAQATCTICTQEKSMFFLGHRLLCMRCDELLIDIEMEIEAEKESGRTTGATDEVEVGRPER